MSPLVFDKMPFPLSNEGKTNDVSGHRFEEKEAKQAFDVKCLFLNNFTHRRIKQLTEKQKSVSSHRESGGLKNLEIGFPEVKEPAARNRNQPSWTGPGKS